MDRAQTPPDDWVQRYLRLLSAEREEPSLAALARLTRRHLLSVPFSNVTSLLRYRAHHGDVLPPVDYDDLLRQWEEGRGSGVCFEIAWTFSRLLTALGYTAFAVPGSIDSFMGGHQAIVVAFSGERYLVDVGNGAPFFDPISLDRVVEVRHAGLSYRLRPGDAPGEHFQERWINEEWTPFCRYELRAQDDAERETVFRRLHTPHEAFVIRELRLVRCTETEVSSIRKADLTRFFAGGKRTERLKRPADYERVVDEVFHLPGFPILEALAVLEGLGDPPE